ncbi:MAG: FGGY-family carbohydrate kinase [Microthrixaceae bacterium]
MSGIGTNRSAAGPTVDGADLRAVRDERYVLAVDFGTGGPKVGVVSLTGKVAHQVVHTVETTYLPGGGATQDPVQWWDLVRTAATDVLDASGIERGHVVAVSVTGQWASTVPVDEAGIPVGPVVMWMDSRGGPEVRRRVGGPVAGYKPRPIAEFIRRSGGAPSLDGADPIGHRLHLKTGEPAVWAAARWMLEPVDYLSMCFTGRAVASPASMTGSWLVDTRNPASTAYDPVLVALGGTGEEKLPPLVPFGSIIGTVREPVANELGLGDDVVVVTGSPDLHTAALGTGAVGRGEANMAVSTTGWISLVTGRKKTDIIRQVATVPGLDTSGYLVANNHETAGMCLAWLRGVLGGEPSFDELTDLAAGSEAGAGGVLFTPWLKGERSPIADGRARAGFHNLSLGTTRADLVRAVMEGVAYNNRWLHDAVERFVGGRLDNLRFFGGGAQSSLWCQIHADVMDRTIEQVADPLYCGLRGAALLASRSLGAVDRSELRSLVEVAQVYTPDPANRAVYDRLFAEFPGLYGAQKKMFHRLNG